MLIIRQYRIYREDLRINHQLAYLFGDNRQRVGMAGQAGEMRGEPNAIGVATKHNPGMAPRDFFDDTELDENIVTFATDLGALVRGVAPYKAIVIPTDGLGTGLSELPKRAPKSAKALNAMLDALGGIPIAWDQRSSESLLTKVLINIGENANV